MIERTIAAATHGRYLCLPPADPQPAGLLVGFHGYAEGAEAQLHRLQAVPGGDRWLVASVQGLHRFYQRRTDEVVASWMTRQDRELAMADNRAYSASVIEALAREWPAPRLVIAGFSQGVAMAFRAASCSPMPVSGVIAVGGDVPPELDAAALGSCPAALVCRGSADGWYTEAKFAADVARLKAAGVAVTALPFDGGHEWSEPVSGAAAAFLRGLVR